MIPTPAQTIGPFFGTALPYPGGADLVPATHPDAIILRGTVRDGAGQPVPDALLELWQADADGSVPHHEGSLHRDGSPDRDGVPDRGGHGFTGWGRAETDTAGRYAFTTLTPGAPFFAITVFARGLLGGLFTRAYLPGRGGDAFLDSLPADRRETLLATSEDRAFRFDVHLQGPLETVFLSYSRH